VTLQNSDERLRQAVRALMSDPPLARTFDDVTQPNYVANSETPTRPQHRAYYLLAAASIIALTTIGAVSVTRHTNQSQPQSSVDTAPAGAPASTMVTAPIENATSSPPAPSSSASIPPETSVASTVPPTEDPADSTASDPPASISVATNSTPYKPCAEANQAEVVNYLKSRVNTFSVGMTLGGCAIEVLAKGLPPDVLKWLKSRPYEVRVVDKAVVPG
jgi:hypothetical protein